MEKSFCRHFHQVINYTTTNAQGQQIIQQRTVMAGGVQVVQRAGQPMKPVGKPMKDPNAPKKPLSAYFLYSQEERLKVKDEFPNYSITEVAKEIGRRWATLDPNLKQIYEHRYQDSRCQCYKKLFFSLLRHLCFLKRYCLSCVSLFCV
jgi:hypothetical protein